VFGLACVLQEFCDLRRCRIADKYPAVRFEDRNAPQSLGPNNLRSKPDVDFAHLPFASRCDSARFCVRGGRYELDGGVPSVCATGDGTRLPYLIPSRQATGKTLNITTLNHIVYGNIVKLKMSAHASSSATTLPASRLPTLDAIQVAAVDVAPQASTTTPKTQCGYRLTCSPMFPLKSAGMGWTTALNNSTATTSANASAIPTTAVNSVRIPNFTAAPDSVTTGSAGTVHQCRQERECEPSQPYHREVAALFHGSSRSNIPVL